ncbi:hypothetical protein KY084_12495 [Stakelama sp. CBK3Z-3]|uniref:Uncharacterized protein n=1 Tax=Stakelama flava TaxID=2860338 RepID=A0ABS6XNA9_9SPHN|nr:hypothetical protein [Stakelama flava]MBW4331689.1 hypothetical protein [Stakelama flava]
MPCLDSVGDARGTPRSVRNHQGEARKTMIDNFSLGLTHGLLMLAAWLLLRRDDLDSEPGPQDDADAPRKGRWGGKRA